MSKWSKETKEQTKISDEACSPSIHIWGSDGTGKTLLSLKAGFLDNRFRDVPGFSRRIADLMDDKVVLPIEKIYLCDTEGRWAKYKKSKKFGPMFAPIFDKIELIKGVVYDEKTGQFDFKATMDSLRVVFNPTREKNTMTIFDSGSDFYLKLNRFFRRLIAKKKIATAKEKLPVPDKDKKNIKDYDDFIPDGVAKVFYMWRNDQANDIIDPFTHARNWCVMTSKAADNFTDGKGTAHPKKSSHMGEYPIGPDILRYKSDVVIHLIEATKDQVMYINRNLYGEKDQTCSIPFGPFTFVDMMDKVIGNQEPEFDWSPYKID